MSLRYAICNETFEGWDHPRICETIAGFGYGGLEIAPFTLAPRITDVSETRRTQLRRQAESAGIQIIGLHWLLAKTEGLHLTSPDADVRARTATYLGELARCCSDLGGDILVFGSPQQRRIPAGVNREQATDFAFDTITRLLPTLQSLGVRLCLEPLAPADTDFLNTCAEACTLIDHVGHPNVCLHLDVKAMLSERIPIVELIRKNLPRTGHFHANDVNLRGPGFGDIDFRPILRTLTESKYDGWVCVEVFDYSPDPETIARESIRYMQGCEDH